MIIYIIIVIFRMWLESRPSGELPRKRRMPMPHANLYR